MTNKKIELIDFLKGFSIFTIVVDHLLPNLPLSDIEKDVVQVGGTGVHTFILVSGFGLYLSHVRKPLNFTGFIKKRFTKIYLPYIIMVAITALISFLIPVSDNSWYAFFGHVFLYKMFDNDIMSTYGFQFWFISTIIQLYLIFNILAWIKTKLSAAAFVGLGLFISVLWMIIVLLLKKEDSASWTRFCFQYVWEFMLGIALAELYVKRGALIVIKQSYLLLMAVVCFGLFGILVLKMGDIGKTVDDFPAMLGYTSLAIFIYQLNIRFINKFFLFTSSISYALYLTHILFFSVCLYTLQIAGLHVNLIVILIILFLTYSVSYLYNRYVMRYL